MTEASSEYDVSPRAPATVLRLRKSRFEVRAEGAGDRDAVRRVLRVSFPYKHVLRVTTSDGDPVEYALLDTDDEAHRFAVSLSHMLKSRP